MNDQNNLGDLALLSTATTLLYSLGIKTIGHSVAHPNNPFSGFKLASASSMNQLNDQPFVTPPNITGFAPPKRWLTTPTSDKINQLSYAWSMEFAIWACQTVVDCDGNCLYERFDWRCAPTLITNGVDEEIMIMARGRLL